MNAGLRSLARGGVLLGVFALPAAAGTVAYSLTWLDSLAQPNPQDHRTLSWASGINDAGVVVGTYTTGAGESGFVWDKNQGIRQLTPLDGYSSSSAQAVNANGDVAGVSFDYGVDGGQGTIWRNSGAMVILGLLPGCFDPTVSAINDLGQAVGWEIRSSGIRVALRWDADGGVHELGTLPGTTESRAYGINSAGQIVGYSGVPNAEDYAFVWDAVNGMRKLDSIPGGAGLGGSSLSFTVAAAINDRGEVAGSSTDASGHMAAVTWDATGALRVLGMPSTSACVNAEVRSINQRGDVVGSCYDGGFEWTETDGFSSSSLGFYQDINEAGQIAGSTGGDGRAFLLTPVAAPRFLKEDSGTPEPSTPLLLLPALLVLIGAGKMYQRRPHSAD